MKEDLLEFVTAKLTERRKKQAKMGLPTSTKPVEIADSIVEENGLTVSWKDAIPWLESYQRK